METIILILFLVALGLGIYSLKKITRKNREQMIKEIEKNG
jgi:hypothetical protein